MIFTIEEINKHTNIVIMKTVCLCLVETTKKMKRGTWMSIKLKPNNLSCCLFNTHTHAMQLEENLENEEKKWTKQTRKERENKKKWASKIWRKKEENINNQLNNYSHIVPAAISSIQKRYNLVKVHRNNKYTLFLFIFFMCILHDWVHKQWK